MFLIIFTGGTYLLDISIPESYPFNPPKVSCIISLPSPLSLPSSLSLSPLLLSLSLTV
jgi:hypothetical protein